VKLTLDTSREATERLIHRPVAAVVGVPVSPTLAMLQAGADQLASGKAGDIVEAIWLAMIRARPM
jgi:hypothetical protein